MFKVPPNFNANVGLSTTAVVNNVLSESDPSSANRYAYEEIFTTIRNEELDDDPEYVSLDGSGRYCFKFPQVWYNSNLNNKSIGLRQIHVKSNITVFKVKFRFKVGTTDKIMNITIKFQPDDSLSSILDYLIYQINNAADVKPYGELFAHYESNGVTFYFYNSPGSTQITAMSFEPASNHFINKNLYTNFLRVIANKDAPPYDAQPFKKMADVQHVWMLRFDDVWDRTTCYVHASFANNAHHNFLGLSGEFYMKPSKIYPSNEVQM